MHVSDAARIVLGVWILTNALHKPECGVACALGCAVLERVRFGRVCGCMLLAFGIAEQTMPFLIGMAECFVQIMSGFIGAYGRLWRSTSLTARTVRLTRGPNRLNGRTFSMPWKKRACIPSFMTSRSRSTTCAATRT